jgi:hypothetical protein
MSGAAAMTESTTNQSAKPTVEEIMELARRFDELPELDSRDTDEILGYDEYGLPG